VNNAPEAVPPRSAGRRISFALLTDPDPVRVSPTSGDPEYANLHFVGTVGGDRAVECQRITVTVPAGQLALHLAAGLDGVEAQVDLDDWTPAPVGANDTFTLRPLSGGALLTPEAGISILLDRVRVNPVVGSAGVTVTAYWREPGTTEWTQATLRWAASTGATLKLLHEGVQHDVTGRAEFTFRLRRSAIFYLRGSRGSAERTLSVLVSVTDPDIDVNNLTVIGSVHTNRLESHLLGRIRIQPPLAPAALTEAGPA
jgi:hypothetical protein